MRKLIVIALLSLASIHARADMIGASGGGGAIPAPPMIWNHTFASAASGVAASSQPYSQAVWVPTTVTVTGFRLGTAVTGSSNIDVAVYSLDFSQQFIHLGSVAASAGVNTYNLGANVVLPAGSYQLVFTASTSVAATFQREAGNTSNLTCSTDSTDAAFPLNSSYTKANFTASSLCFQVGMILSGGSTL